MADVFVAAPRVTRGQHQRSRVRLDQRGGTRVGRTAGDGRVAIPHNPKLVVSAADVAQCERRTGSRTNVRVDVVSTQRQEPQRDVVAGVTNQRTSGTNARARQRDRFIGQSDVAELQCGAQ